MGLDGLLEDFAGDDLADLDGEFLEVVEGGAPGGLPAPRACGQRFWRCPGGRDVLDRSRRERSRVVSSEDPLREVTER